MEDLVHDIVRTAAGLEAGFTITDDMKLQDIPNLDSLGHARLMVEIDRIVEVQLDMDEILSIESVANIRSLLQAKGRASAES